MLVGRTTVAATQRASHDSAAQTAWGGSVGVDLLWRAFRHYALFVGLAGEAALPRITVVVGNAPPATIPAVSVGAHLGFRFAP